MVGPIQPQGCSIKKSKYFGIVFTLSILIALTSCTTVNQTEIVTPNQTKVTLITGGYGYEIGDIVLIDTRKEPAVGDIVQYDWDLNKSSFMAMGSGRYLARIIGLPGDNVTFKQQTYEVNGFTINMTGQGRLMWGAEPFNNVTGMKLNVPEGEFLADKFLGYEGYSQNEGGSIPYIRLTVKRQAIIGIILRKLGHDQAFEQEVKGRVY